MNLGLNHVYIWLSDRQTRIRIARNCSSSCQRVGDLLPTWSTLHCFCILSLYSRTTKSLEGLWEHPAFLLQFLFEHTHSSIKESVDPWKLDLHPCLSAGGFLCQCLCYWVHEVCHRYHPGGLPIFSQWYPMCSWYPQNVWWRTNTNIAIMQDWVRPLLEHFLSYVAQLCYFTCWRSAYSFRNEDSGVFLMWVVVEVKVNSVGKCLACNW